MDPSLTHARRAKTARDAAEYTTLLLEGLELAKLPDEDLQRLCVEVHLLSTTLADLKLRVGQELAERGI